MRGVEKPRSPLDGPAPRPRYRRRSGCNGVVLCIEALVWSAATRLLLAALPTERVIRLLNALPRWPTAPKHVTPPADRHVVLAGACLGRTLARSQYLRMRRQQHTVVIGVRGSPASFDAHAWLDPYDAQPGDFVEIRRIPR